MREHAHAVVGTTRKSRHELEHRPSNKERSPDQRSDFAAGEMARDNYLMRSQCSSMTVPLLSGMHADVRAKRDAKPSIETVECVDYQGCQAGSPLKWCEHSYGGYDNTTHGWPPPGGQMIWDFVNAL
jgi:hypothetical protein